jgi:hypothetical protein
LSCLIGSSCANAAYLSDHGGPALGDVHFQTTCDPKVQSQFDYATALLHSFEFGEAARAFRNIEREDPTCSIAAWGVALSELERRGPAMPKATLTTGWDELKPWLSRPAKSQREQMYISAVSTMYEGYENTTSDERWKRYIAQMANIRRERILALCTCAGLDRGIRSERNCTEAGSPRYTVAHLSGSS